MNGNLANISRKTVLFYYNIIAMLTKEKGSAKAEKLFPVCTLQDDWLNYN